MTGRGDAEIINLAGTWGLLSTTSRSFYGSHDATERRSVEYHQRKFSTTFKDEVFEQGNSQGYRDGRFPAAKSGALQFSDSAKT